MIIVSIDPGESTGVVLKDTEKNTVQGYTFCSTTKLWNLLLNVAPQVVIYEQFALRQSAALSLIGNKFITCEVIGVIKLYCDIHEHQCKLITLQPANKQFCGFSSNPKDDNYKVIKIMDGKITEHVRDAYRLLIYGELFKMRK